MPLEPQQLNYILGHRDGGLPILSGEPLTDDDRQPFTEAEVALFDARFEAIFKWMNFQGIAPVVGKEHHDKLLYLAEVQKKIFGGDAFTGDGVGGFGMRQIVPEDVFGNQNDRSWELANGIVAVNWRTGLTATRHTRNHMGFTQRDSGDFFAGASMVTQDANQDKWAIAYFGYADLRASGLIQGEVISFSNRERDYFEFQDQMHLDNITYCDLGKMVYFNHKHPFKDGLIVRPATVAENAAIGAVAAMKPIGVCFVSQRRALQQNQLPRPMQS